jgi:hypothetical protein
MELLMLALILNKRINCGSYEFVLCVCVCVCGGGRPYISEWRRTNLISVGVKQLLPFPLVVENRSFYVRQHLLNVIGCTEQLWGPPDLLPNGYQSSFPRGKARPRRDADHSSTEVKNEWAIFLPPPHLVVCMAVAGQLLLWLFESEDEEHRLDVATNTMCILWHFNSFLGGAYSHNLMQAVKVNTFHTSV